MSPRATLALAGLLAAAAATLAWLARPIADAAEPVPAETGPEAVGAAAAPAELAGVGEAPAPSSSRSDDETSRARSMAASEAAPAEVVDVQPERAAAAADAALGVVVYGTLSDPAGRPLASGGVNLRDARGNLLHCRVTDGAWARTGLERAVYRLSAGARGWRTLERELDLTAAREPVRLDLVVEPTPVVAVRVVTGDERPLRFVLMEVGGFQLMQSFLPVATRDDPGATFAQVGGSKNNANGIGRWYDEHPRDEPLPPDAYGCLVLDEPLPATVSLLLGHHVLASRRVEPGETEVLFELDLAADVRAALATIEGRLVAAESGAPLAGRVAWNEDVASLEIGDAAEGAFRLESVCPGKVRFTASAEGRERVQRELTVAPGARIALGDVPLAVARTIRGRVTDPEGEPLGLSLSCGRIDPVTDRVRYDVRRGYGSSPERGFVVDGLGAGRYLLRLHSDEMGGVPGDPPTTWSSRGVVVDTRAGDVTGVVIVAGPAVPVALQPRYAAPERRVARVIDATGYDLRRHWLEGGVPLRLKLVAGDYELVVERDGEELVRRAFTVADAPVELPVE